MAPENRAAWLKEKHSTAFVIDSAPYSAPSEGEIVIKTKAVAINPADWIIQRLGVLLEDYPAILGADVAGEVVECHGSLSGTFSVGDLVIGAAGCLQRKDGKYAYSGFQEYVVLKTPNIAKIPEGVSCEDAVVLPLGINTSAMSLFVDETLGLQLPSMDFAKTKQQKTLLVWGASSSVGSCAVQLAASAGYEVVGVASTKNHGMVEGLGARHCIDQASATVVDDAMAVLDGKDVVGAFDGVALENLDPVIQILGRCKGRKLVVSVRPEAEKKSTNEIEVVTNFPASVTENWKRNSKEVWRWLGEAMRTGNIKYMPKAEVVGNSLDEIQQAVDTLAQGVSAKKLVVTIP